MHNYYLCKMKLSIVIVNYNVEYFLEQCLLSVRNAMPGIEGEVWVVDNNSVDGSMRMLQEKFPEVKVIANKENVGFSKANNQAIAASSGEFVLLLNPDTVIEADTLKKTIAFMEDHPEAGALGVMMVDGKGKFLPESKRGLPTPNVAFYKIFGLARLFPKSHRFGKYHLSYLDKQETQDVDVLSGAFMLMRREALKKTGLLDEDYFMYGEDIDLSYRIQKAGYRNYYYPHTRIIHYKGESTKKGSLNYVFMFYNAMIIFARKHFSSKNAKYFSFLINMAIWFRASIALSARIVRKALLPVIDGVMIIAGFFLIKNYWERTMIFPDGGHYPIELIQIALPVYTGIWLLSVFLSGGYDKPFRMRNAISGLAIGTALILIFYSLLDEQYRFSRALILIGSLWAVLSIFMVRAVFTLLKIEGVSLINRISKRLLIVGDAEESDRVRNILQKSLPNISFMGLVNTEEEEKGNNEFIGTLRQLDEIVSIYKINEIIFCARNLPAHIIIDKMSELSQQQIEFKIAPPESLFIIGSNSINSSGDMYLLDVNNIGKPANLRKKRLLDLNASVLFLVFLPLIMLVMRQPLRFPLNLLMVLFGYRSWVGFNRSIPLDHKLPLIRKGILNPVDQLKNPVDNPKTIDNLNILYARDYRLWNDIQIIFKGFRQLGRK